MKNYADPKTYRMPRPTTSIWGKVQDAEQVSDLPVWRVDTPGHGGYIVLREWANDHLTQSAIEVGDGVYGARSGGTSKYLFYEEDCNWCVLAWELSEYIKPQDYNYTIKELMRVLREYVSNYDYTAMGNANPRIMITME